MQIVAAFSARITDHPRGYIRTLCSIGLLLLVLQAVQLAPSASEYSLHFMLFGLFGFVIAAVCITGVVGRPPLQRRIQPLWVWSQQSRLHIITTSIVLFEIVMLPALWFDPLFVGGAEPLGALAFTVSMGYLLATKLWMEETTAYPLARYQGNRQVDIIVVMVIVVIGVIISVRSLGLFPMTGGGSDALVYFNIAESLQRGEGVPQQYNYYSYLYPFVITTTRQVVDSLMGLLVLQHGLRILSAVMAFWLLKPVHYIFATALGILLAVSPLTAIYANLMFTESIYSSLLILATIGSYRLTSINVNSSRVAIIVGLLWGLVAVFRPVALFIIIPVLVLLLLLRLQRSRLLIVLIGFGIALFAFSGLRALLDGHFSFGADDTDTYFGMTYLYQGLHNVDNGPLATELESMITSGEYCDVPTDILVNWDALAWGFFITRFCMPSYNRATDADMNMRAIYVEAIRAHPGQFVSHVYGEMRHFLTVSERDNGISDPSAREYAYVIHPFFVGVSGNMCTNMAIDVENNPDLADRFAYFCEHPYVNQPVPRRDGLGLEWLNLDVMQPYRLQSSIEWARFWTMLALVGNGLLNLSTRLRPLFILCLMIIGYHAGVTAVAQYNLPRYTMVLAPVFTVIATLIYLSVVDAVVDWLHRRKNMPKVDTVIYPEVQNRSEP